jgi:hypothetical protein
MLLSQNLTLILNKVLTDQSLCKLIAYNDTKPLSQPDISDTKTLMLDRLMPYPFDTKAEISDTVQLRVYYIGGDFTSNHVIDETRVSFDIVVAKSLWLINNGKSAVRPYEIMTKLVEMFHEHSIDTVGILKFKSFRHVPFNAQFDCIQLVAEMTTY